MTKSSRESGAIVTIFYFHIRKVATFCFVLSQKMLKIGEVRGGNESKSGRDDEDNNLSGELQASGHSNEIYRLD
jgi:hypothetical protein